MTSPQVSFDDHLDRHSHQSLTAEEVVSIMVGDRQRIRLYGERGWQIPQEVPGDVWEAFLELVDAGCSSRLIDVQP